jgi:endonuclease YncB( thermonuclease family)
LRRLSGTLVAAVIASVAVAHAVRRHPSDDWAAFDHRSFAITAVIDGDAVRLDRVGDVALLGVTAPHGPERGASAASAYLASHAVGVPMTVLLEMPQTRDPQGRLLAYLFEPDGQPLNVAMVRDGAAYAERRSTCLLSGSIQLAETAARKKKLGFWNGLKFDQMPLWRQWWLATLPKRGEL